MAPEKGGWAARWIIGPISMQWAWWAMKCWPVERRSRAKARSSLMAAHADFEFPEPIARFRTSVPAALGGLVMQLLEKNPADRPQSADELRRRLDGLPDEVIAPAQATVPTGPVRRSRSIPWSALLAVGAALVGIATGALLTRSRGVRPEARSVIAALAPPAGRDLRPDGGLALSADDTRLAFTATEPSGATAIWIRHLDSLTPTRVEGTEGASGPFWSPDGSMLGYFAGGQLRVMDLQGGSRRALCPAPRPGGGTWTPQGLIVYSPDFLSVPLFKVSAGGGPCTALTSFRGNEAVHRRPYTLPGGRQILFSSGRTGGTSIVAVDLTTGAITDVLRDVGEAVFAAPDWMLYRQLANGAVYAQRLDLKTLRPSGTPQLVMDRVVGVRTLPSYAASPNVLVALQMTSAARSLVWVNRKSVVVDSIPVPGGPAPFFGATSAGVAHDGRRIAFAAAGPLWLFDRDRRIASQAQTGIVPGQGTLDPDWSPGDSLIVYRTLFSGTLMLRLHHLENDTSDSLFASGMRNLRTPDWSPDGKRIAFQLSAGDSAPNDEIWIYSLLDKRATRAWALAANLSAPRWSPDGQWMAYVSDEIGAPEVFVRRVSGSSVALRVSNAGGDFPYWRSDGRELYYRAPDGGIMAVQVTLGPRAVLSPPSVVLAAPPFSRTVRSFEVTPDGERFVGFGREDPLLFTLVTNWPARVK